MITLKQAEQALANCEPFNAGNLRGERIRAVGREFFAVYSYNEMIGMRDIWHTNAPIWVTSHKFSKTTSKHTNIVKRAWGLN